MEQYTKKKILDSFNKLIKTKDFDSITVKMIVDEAGVGRATFYRHFKDKYDVMNYNFGIVIEEYFFSKSCDSFEDLFAVFLNIGTEKWSSLTKMFDSSGANSLHKFIYETSYNASKVVLMNKVGPENITDADLLRLSIFCHGIPFAFEEWVNGKYNMTPEEGAKAAMVIVPRELHGSIWHD